MARPVTDGSWPGQALAYKIGQLKILELRTQAQTRLGDKFDIRRFHDAVLLAGPLPLDLLEARINAWIAKQRGHQTLTRNNDETASC